MLAPRKERAVSFTKSSPWFTTELRALKAKNRQLEQQYKKSGLTVHKLMYDEQLVQYSEALKMARTEYYSQVISDGTANPNKMFKVINKLLKPTNSLICSSVQQCNKFLKFFDENIENIYQSISSVSLCASPVVYPSNFQLNRFSSFKTVTINYIS